MNTLEYKLTCNESQEKLLAICYRITKDLEMAKDLRQEVLLRAWKHRYSYSEVEKFLPWIKTIANNLHISQYRKMSKAAFYEAQRPAVISYSRNDGESLLRCEEIEKYMEHIPIQNKIPLNLFIEGAKYEDIAQELGLPLGTIKSQIFHARRKLAGILDNES